MNIPCSSRLTYLLCSTQRSGTNYLADALKDSGVAGNPDEYFHTDLERTCYAMWGCSSYREYVTAIRERTSTKNGVCGIRVMGDYATEVADDLRHNFTMPPETPTREVFEEALGPCTYLYLHRRDKIRQAISFLRARQSGVWRVEHSDANHSEAPRFDAEAIDRYRARFIQQDAFWTQYFREGNISPLTLYYEDIVADDRSAVVRRILNYLQIAQGTDVAIHPPQTIKQADAISEEWYDRYKLLRN